MSIFKGLAIIGDSNLKNFMYNKSKEVTANDDFLIILSASSELKPKVTIENALHLGADCIGDFLFIDHHDWMDIGFATVEELFELKGKNWYDII